MVCAPKLLCGDSRFSAPLPPTVSPQRHGSAPVADSLNCCGAEVIVLFTVRVKRTLHVREIDKVMLREALTPKRVVKAFDPGIVRGFAGPTEV